MSTGTTARRSWLVGDKISIAGIPPWTAVPPARVLLVIDTSSVAAANKSMKSLRLLFIVHLLLDFHKKIMAKKPKYQTMFHLLSVSSQRPKGPILEAVNNVDMSIPYELIG
jgi:hypothetical protein